MTNSLISKLKRFSLFPLAILLILSSSVLIDQKAYADEHDDKVRAWVLYMGQNGDSDSNDPGCFHGIDKIDFGDVTGNSLGGSGFSRERTVQNKKMSCTAIYNEGIPKWGFSDAEDFLTAAKYKQDKKAKIWYPTSGYQGAVNRAIRSKLKISNDDPKEYLSPGELYSYYYSDFVSTCSVKDEKNRSEFNSSQTTLADQAADGYISYSKIGKDGNNDTVQRVIAKYKGPDKKVYREHGGTVNKEDKQTCIDKSKKVTEQAQAAVKEAEKNKANTGGNVNTGTGEQSAQTAGGSEDKEEDSKSRCAIDGIGWIICPVVNFLADISDDSAGILAKLLEVNSFILTNRGPDSAFFYWSRVRDIANIVFIIVFLIVIYSQVSGLGISNYGIKKLLPKLLMTIVLVNVSFYVCSFLVDISNIVGSSSFNFISSLGGGGSGPEGGWATKGNMWGGVAAAVLAGTAGFFLLATLVSGLIFVVVTAAVTVFLLGARQALVIFTIILSPLAFVALLLPSTEGLFKKWWGFFKTLLSLYPAIGLLYGACNLGATVINSMKGESSVLLQIIAAALTFTPLLLVSRLTSMMTSMMGLAKVADAWGQKAGNAVGKKSQNMLNESKWGKYMDHRDQVKKERKAQIQAGTYRGTKNPFTWGRAARSWGSRKVNRAIGAGANFFGNEAGKRMIEDLGTEASWQEDKRYDESIKKAKNMYENDVSYIDSKTGYKTRLGNKQFVDMARGLGDPDIKPTDSAGNVITSIPLPQTTSERRYILDRAGRSANAEQFVQLAELANSLQSEGERAALAKALDTSSGAKKHGWWGGAAQRDVMEGNFDLQESIVRAINTEKFGKPDEIAAMDKASTQLIHDALSQPGPRVSAQELQQAQDRMQESARLALKDKQVKNEIRSRQSIKDTVDNWSRGKF